MQPKIATATCDEKARLGGLLDGRWRSILHLPAALLLLIAALLKVHQLATSPLVDNFLFDSRVLNVVFTCAELVLSVLLISRWQAGWIRLLAIALFAVFSFVTLFQHVSGESSCGCFGVFVVPPLVTMAIDVFVIACLISWRPTRAAQFHKIYAVATVFLLIGSLSAVSTLKTVAIEDVLEESDTKELIVVDQMSLKGKVFSLSGFIEGESEQIHEGVWKVILYHEDCPKCQALLEAADQAIINTAFVEIPPYESPERTDTELVKWFRLSDRYNWFVSAPLEILCVDGEVQVEDF